MNTLYNNQYRPTKSNKPVRHNRFLKHKYMKNNNNNTNNNKDSRDKKFRNKLSIKLRMNSYQNNIKLKINNINNLNNNNSKNKSREGSNKK